MGTVERLDVQEVPNRPKTISGNAFAPSVAQTPERPNPALAALNRLLPVFGALAAVLAIRLFLLLAVVGAFVLSEDVLASSAEKGLWVLIAYCLFTILPLVWMDICGKKKG